MTFTVPRGVRFVWTDAAGDSIHPDGAQLEVTPANENFVTWTPHQLDPFRGTFTTGGFAEVETSFAVTLELDGTTLVSAPGLLLHISP
jgi:hypothetical protein